MSFEVILPDYSPADVIRQLCINLGLGTFPTGSAIWPVFVSQEPDLPDNCITIYNTSGDLSGRHQITGEVQEFPGIMFQVRGVIEGGNPMLAPHRVAYKKISDIVRKMDQQVLDNTVIITDLDKQTQFKVHSAHRKGTIRDAGRPPAEGNRQIYTVNYVFSVEYNNPTS